MVKRILLLMVFLCIFSDGVLAATAGTTSPTNVVVDFDSTYYDSNLRPGDSGILNLAIENTGGFRADDVEVYIPSTGVVSVDKKFYIGRVDPEQSKTVPVVVRVKEGAKTGLTAINVRISYDGFKYDGTSVNNLLTTWDVPLRIYGNPLFQLNPEKTTYYKDTLGDLVLEGTLRSSVEDLEATLSSDCLTVIGSSRKYIGDIEEGDDFTLGYQIKPSAEGACMVSLKIDYTDESGTSASRNMSFGLNVESAGIDFKVLNVSYEPTGPGETVELKMGLKNYGAAAADDVTASLTLSEPFVPVDTAEKHIGTVESGEDVQTEFEISISWDAEIQTYAIPLTIDYTVGGTSYTDEKSIGLDVSGQVILEVINVDQERGSLRIEVANIGTRAAEGVKATVKTSDLGNRTFDRSTQSTDEAWENRASQRQSNPVSMLSGRGMVRPSGGARQSTSDSGTSAYAQTGSQEIVSYKSDIKPTKQTTFTFDTTVSGPFTLTLEYAGLNGERVTQVETFNLGGGSSTAMSSFTGSSNRNSGSGLAALLMKAVIVLVVVVGGYKLYKRRKKK
ncbi:MAG: hypothetical protein GF416_04800 [Candidatus Altiarchaeales archaeon]|nr:hypothetical protein [Candidatus Altiarchaeales archaeon]MBD3416439.1 hypothetical protein [Candidatus Altiarchaeales archaeon]